MICSQSNILPLEENDSTKQILNVQAVKHDNEIDASILSCGLDHTKRIGTIFTSPVDTRRSNNVIITSKWRRDDVALT